MSYRISRSDKLLLFTGAALIFLWEVTLAVLGDHGLLSWAPIAVGTAFLFIAFFNLHKENRR